MVESATFFIFFTQNKIFQSTKLVIQKLIILKLFVFASPNEFFFRAIFFTDFLEFLVSFIILDFCRSVVLGLNISDETIVFQIDFWFAITNVDCFEWCASFQAA